MNRFNLFLFFLILIAPVCSAQSGPLSVSAGIGAAESVKTPYEAVSVDYARVFESLRVQGSASMLWADCAGLEMSVGAAAGIQAGRFSFLPGLVWIYAPREGRFLMGQSLRAGVRLSERLEAGFAGRYDQRTQWRAGLFIAANLAKR